MQTEQVTPPATEGKVGSARPFFSTGARARLLTPWRCVIHRSISELDRTKIGELGKVGVSLSHSRYIKRVSRN